MALELPILIKKLYPEYKSIPAMFVSSNFLLVQPMDEMMQNTKLHYRKFLSYLKISKILFEEVYNNLYGYLAHVINAISVRQ